MANAAQVSGTTAMAQENKKLKAELAALKRSVGGANGAGAAAGNDGTVFCGYCHTHGPSTTHDSATCRKPGHNHNPRATMANKMGGREEPYGRGRGKGSAP